jgi:hypothetical protein
MTRLFIDNKEVNLPSDMELELYRCNPFFTKNGDYTFEIEIDLKDPSNRKVYQNLNRMDVTKRPENRSALLICDGVKVIEGTEIVLSMDEDKADIQIVADNSDINYLLGDEESIRDFDLGEVTMTREQANACIEKYYPESPVAICPASSRRYKLKKGYTRTEYNYFPPSTYGTQAMSSDSTVNPQPYVLYILQKVVESLGYKVAYNQLTQVDLFNRIFFVHSFEGEPFQKMAPDMTRQDFIEECEKFFNCVLIADSIKKEVSIYQINTFYENKPKTYINKVLETFKKEYDNEDTVNMNYTNVAYSSNLSDKFKRVDKEIVAKCEVLTWDDFSTLVSKSFSDDYYDDFYIHKVAGDSIEYVPEKDTTTFKGAEGRYERVFNRFADIVDEEDEDTDKVELGFVPATPSAVGNIDEYGGSVMDDSSDVDTTSDDDEEQGLLDALENGLEEEETPEFFRIGINAGIQPCWDRNGQAVASKYCVQSWIDSVGYQEGYTLKDGSTKGVPSRSYTHFNPELTLALAGENGLYARFYSKNKKVNTTVKYTISFVTDKILDPKTIFVINNQEYYCNQLKYTIRPNGKDKVCEGEFYMVKEESTE